jgi:hypothetical protein
MRHEPHASGRHGAPAGHPCRQAAGGLPALSEVEHSVTLNEAASRPCAGLHVAAQHAVRLRSHTGSGGKSLLLGLGDEDPKREGEGATEASLARISLDEQACRAVRYMSAQLPPRSSEDSAKRPSTSASSRRDRKATLLVNLINLGDDERHLTHARRPALCPALGGQNAYHSRFP